MKTFSAARYIAMVCAVSLTGAASLALAGCGSSAKSTGDLTRVRYTAGEKNKLERSIVATRAPKS